MPFTGDILRHKSLSIVGLEKNTGKTECLSYILKQLRNSRKKLAVTSVGIDGESVDQVTSTHKPEIELFNDVIFVTSERHFRTKQLDAEILDVSDRQTALGRLITARAKGTGKVIFSGPSDSLWLGQTIGKMDDYQVDTTLVDGALSRLSLGSPAVTESMILTTGAAVSANIPTLVAKTRFVFSLTQTERLNSPVNEQLLRLPGGFYTLDHDWNITDLQIPSVFLLEKNRQKLTGSGNYIYVTGVVTDSLVNFLRVQKKSAETTLVVRDFTRLFISRDAYRAFTASGGRIMVLLKAKLLAVCVNPVSPEGITLNSEKLCAAMNESLGIPVYDVKKL
ncbi:MAG: hypothetical protein JNL22_07810 [Bacteroidales bacterium]|jgi:hypothetical protein|nr:hypothetical protein [Bacteroidales bacterium]